MYIVVISSITNYKLQYIYISTLSAYNENKVNPYTRCSSFVLEKYHGSTLNDRKIKNIKN